MPEKDVAGFVGEWGFRLRAWGVYAFAVKGYLKAP